VGSNPTGAISPFFFIFFMIPENILIEKNIIKTLNDDKDKKYETYIYIKPDEHDKEKYWYNKYKYNITDKDINNKINNLFTIQS